MTLDQEIREKIVLDYKMVSTRMYDILESGDNQFVVDPDYVNPSVEGKTSIKNQEGEFRYLSRIREALERVLSGEKVARELLPPRAPDYWANLVKRSKQ